MGELIELAVKAVAWTITRIAYITIQTVRLAVKAVTYTARITVGLIRQRNAKRSPDGRYWWSGRAWVPVLPPSNWGVPIAAGVCIVLVAGVCTAAVSQPAPSGNLNTNTTSPGSDTTPVATETETNATPSVTAQNLPPAKSQTCGDPHAHVYSPDRLQLLAPCVTVTGTVDVIRTESDGDLHVLMRLDSGESKYLNAKNISAENGDLVTEPVCVNSPIQADAVAACTGYHNPLSIPAVGTHVAATGAWVLDLDHGWMELHPVFAFNAAGAASSAAPPPSAAHPPSAAPPVANSCGAPQNPWNYTFCGGNLITSPNPAFCSYFRCISSFWNGTGYVVQCADGSFSKSGGRIGVCSQHGGFKRNLYLA